MSKSSVIYKVTRIDRNAHLIHVSCTINHPQTVTKITMPAWIPGSYYIRDFSQHIVQLNTDAELTKLDKQTWEITTSSNKLEIDYCVYCFDESPRGCYVNQDKIFIQGSSLFLQVVGCENSSIQLELPGIEPIHTTLSNTKDLYHADDYYELIDHPIAIGNYQVIDFTCHNIQHSIVFIGQHIADFARLSNDVQIICNGHINYFGEPPNFSKYIFFLQLSQNGYGGIEHRSSTSLLASRDSLPNNSTDSVKYQQLLGLFSHEYLHAWHVKRIMPQEFIQPDLSKEVYTEQLWIFEGITSYLDDFNLLANKLLTLDEYLETLSKSLTRIVQNPGTTIQSLADSSFYAWNKFYQQNENSANAIVSYYQKGAFVALALDLLIIDKTQGQFNLRSIMQQLWYNFGKQGIGLKAGDFIDYSQKVTGLDLSDFFTKTVYSNTDLDYASYFSLIGMELISNQVSGIGKYGIRLIPNSTKISTVINSYSAEKSGLQAKDEIIAINNYQVSSTTISKIIDSFSGDEIDIHVFRDGFLSRFNICPDKFLEEIRINIIDNPQPSQKKNLKFWLNRA